MRKYILVVLVFMLVGCIPAQGQPASSTSQTTLDNPKIAFSVGPDQVLTYPGSLTTLPDEHTTFMPPAPGSDTYLVFGASVPKTGGGLVLTTKDLHSFVPAGGYPSPVISPALNFTTCRSTYDPEFDLNYSAPGSVLQDPTRAPGNLIMIYEAENHCPGGVWQQPFYVTVGLARSADNGRTWPPPVDSELGGPERYPVLKGSVPEPTTPERPPAALGDALPSAFIDGRSIYIAYTFSNPGGDRIVRVARAALGGNGQLSFLKWNNGAFSGAGIGGPDSGVLPSRVCNGYQLMPSISYSDSLHVYLMTFVCVSGNLNAGGNFQPARAAWYFSTATSLDLQNWSMPQMILNSDFPVSHACSPGGSGDSFDGWYPSFLSPGSAAGHVSQTGYVFFLNGCDTGRRTFRSRTFTITVQ
ncbi:MAG TPA: hypothetical protein VLZ89_14770 [Anaerolineales bacterium]|nr:hypothetical protein [Anaerolineales bacterium]